MRIFRFIDSVSEWSGRVASFLIFCIVIITTTEVVLRYVFNRPTLWSWELNVQLFLGFFALGGVYHILHKRYITVEIVYNRFPPKVKLFVDLISIALFLVLFAVLIKEEWLFAWNSIVIRQTSYLMWVHPLYPMKVLFFLAVVWMLIQRMANAIRDFRTDIAVLSGGSTDK
ncbi:TRAP transporter small permease subunit [Chloroflexota bacterium]